MRDSQLRLTVVAPRSDSPVVDVTVAADCPVGTVVPDLVDVVIGAAATASPRRWHVSRSTGGLLDTSKTLRDNGVGDGDILLLDAVGAPAPRLVPVDAASVVADCARTHSASAGPAVREGVGLLVVAVLITVLVGSGRPEPGLWVAAALSAAAATVVLADRRCPLPATFSVGAALLAAVTGYLASPGALWQFGATVAAAAGCAMSLLLRHAMGPVAHVAIAHTAIAAAAGAVVVAGAVSAAARLPVEAGGAALATVSVAALTAAARIVVGLGGLSPSRPTVTADRAAAAQRVLTGLTVGWAAAAALGAVAAVVGRTPAGGTALALAAMVGLALLLRAHGHADPARRVALRTAGAVGFGAAFIGATVTYPAAAAWLCAVAATAGVAAAYRRGGGGQRNPVARQALQVVEYAAVAAVVPFALWTAGVYGWARGLGLP
ncbi:type VII secretion integral membrane protein EccD [Mycolicibacterium duvalii]|uniref:EccD-like transmembrane domain-containing protein n=1 Tax=Mycolicibacterium duvalii TaxID=39688 RepID=A0A7I7K2R2_9MYCO|nr:type VII secretion integral membrane protein EccD [Mycolicibacterium duvalii]MCV7367959.1 type VII secretion integral membrane protein EccD [Mycolicibacterium duvalii]PEG39038.1 type VII secretion integral membrane protein EccD [Mycolicibacterium duvalii]BBX18450.1 hypothetical protein MDUV_33100 [Mycolicibacterium duvalii]